LVKEVIEDKVILLNRFPTLHRMNIQAFYPIASDEENVMKIPVTVCAGFNADFDGDQFSIHLPISSMAQKEAKQRLLPSRNIISPASGLYTPVSLNKDIIAGLYWLTMNPGMFETVAEVSSFEEAVLYVKDANVAHHQGIAFIDGRGGRIVTTVGRIVFNLLRERGGADFINDPIDQKKLDAVLSSYGAEHGPAKCVAFIEKIKDLGFLCTSKTGISISYFDFPVLATSAMLKLYDSAGDLELIKAEVEETLISGLSVKAHDSLGIIINSGAGKRNSFFQICGF